MGFGTLQRCLLLASVLGAMLQCKKKDTGGASETAALSDFEIEVTGNPFQGVGIFLPSYTNADQARRRIRDQNPAEAALVSKIADTPQARWLGE